MNNSYKLFCSQVSGKQPKLLSNDQTQILKGYNEQQYKFYTYINELKINEVAYTLTKFIPSFQGIKILDSIPDIYDNQNVKDKRTLEWLDHLRIRYAKRNLNNKFILLQNISHKFIKPNVIDIKIGIRQLKGQGKKTKENSQHFFLLNGCRLNIPTQKYKQLKIQQQINMEESIQIGEPIDLGESIKIEGNRDHQNFKTLFFSKYFYKTIKSDQNILLYLALYFYDGKKIRIKLLKQTINKLRQLIINFKVLPTWRFHSVSLCVFYDATNDQVFQLKLIDFGRSERTDKKTPDKYSIEGLQNIHKFFMKIEQNHGKLQNQIPTLIQQFNNQTILVVPQTKVKQYGYSSRQDLDFSPKIQKFDILCCSSIDDLTE